MMKNNVFKKFVLWPLIAILCLAILIWLFSPRPVQIDRVTIKAAPFQQSIEEDGKTRAKDIFKIIAPIQGELQRVTFDPGDTVKKGEVIATIIPNKAALLDIRTRKVLQAFLLSQQASVQRAKALVARAQAAVITAESDYTRNFQLAQQHFVSESDLEQFQLQLNLRKKEYDAAVAELEEIKQRAKTVRSALLQFSLIQQSEDPSQDKIFIRSPEDARILTLQRESAGSIQQGDVIMTLANINKLEIVADFLSTDAIKIPVNAKVVIKRWGQDYPLEGHVRLIEPNGFTKTSALGVEEERVNVIIDFDSPQAQWKKLGAGYRVDTEVILFTKQNARQVPVSALFRDGDKWAVFVITRGKARKQFIALGPRNDTMAVVLNGLKAGDTVINYPSDEISDGVKVTP